MHSGRRRYGAFMQHQAGWATLSPFAENEAATLPDRSIFRRAGYLLAAAGLLAGQGASAQGATPVAVLDATTAPLSIHIRNDRLTLRVAKAPQIYFSGVFDAAALRRVRALMQSGQMPAGADVYLDSPSGDVAAGMELGRLLRAARLNTHLGVWRPRAWHGTPARPATCLDACAYAWLGGVYRWPPSGGDRIGLREALLPDRQTAAPGSPSPQSLRDYMRSMGVRQDYFAHVLGPVVNGVVWWKPDKMAPWLVANNGRQPLAADYRPAPGAPTLALSQVVRGGRHQITLQCAPGHVTVSARDSVGGHRARQLAARAMYAYFEVDRQPKQQRQGDRPTADGDALVFTRQLPFAELAPMLHTVSLGAWIEVAGNPVRFGFLMAPVAVEPQTRTFYADCQALQPGFVRPAQPAKQDKPSFWRRLFGRKR